MRGLDAGRIAADLQAVAAEHAGKGAECRHPERGLRAPSDDTVARLARPLGLTFDEVWALQRRRG